MPLRLKSLELQGYKTFASRSVFEFASGITAIVGPNGSGKSNIADSLRWVLGEQSYSLLRGKKTEDMIFAGSEHRPRSGMAQATITFDNTEMWLPLDFSEVALERRAYRDGRNDYLLNGQHIRLREINELLSQAGLSERTYTILGQGLVDASLALKAEERRRLFEEAAGVGLYRSRREDALKRLDHTERNLERVLDIMAELEPRLRSLERQAKRAIEFTGAQAELKVTLRQWYGYHWHRSQKDLADIRQAVKRQEIRVQEARDRYEKAHASSSSFRERLSGLRAQLNTWHRESAELHNQWESISRELAVLEERRRAHTARQASLMADEERAADELKVAQEQLAEAEKDVLNTEQEFNEAIGQQTSGEEALKEQQAERSRLDEELTQVRARVDELNLGRSENQARLDELRERIQLRQEKMDSLGEHLAQAEAEVRRVEEQSETARQAREKAQHELAGAESALQERRRRLEKLDAGRRAALDARAKQESEHSRAHAQREVLEQAEQSLTGYAEGARFLLEAAQQSRLKGSRGALSGLLDVPADLETAITAALGESLDAVLLETEETEGALSLLDSEDSARAALVPLRPRETPNGFHAPDDPDCLGIALDLVKVEPDLQQAVSLLLGRVLAVRNRTAARRLLAGIQAPARLVT